MKAHTEASYRRRIARVVEEILLRPGAPHTLESLAAIAHLSPFHFHRVYRALTGESVGETVRRVRVAQAADRLAHVSGTVTEIALDIGYNSPQAFARAFRGFAGVSPSEFQVRQRDLGMPLDGAMPVRLVELPSTDALCLRHEGPIATIPHTFSALRRRLGFERCTAKVRALVGIGEGDPQRGNFRYQAGIVPAVLVDPVSNVESRQIAGGLYAAYRLTGSYELIAVTFRNLFERWLPHGMLEFTGGPTVELYHTSRARTAPNERVTDLLIPVKRKRASA